MKALFHSVLYVSLGISALFFSAWTVVYFPFFDRSVMATEKVKSDLPKKTQPVVSKEKKKKKVPPGPVKAEEDQASKSPVSSKGPVAKSVVSKEEKKKKVLPGPVKAEEDQALKSPASSKGPVAKSVVSKEEKKKKVPPGPVKAEEDQALKSPASSKGPVAPGSSPDRSKTSARDPSSIETREGEEKTIPATTQPSDKSSDVSGNKNVKLDPSQGSQRSSSPQNATSKDINALVPSGLKNEVKSKVSEIYQILSEYQYDAESPQRPNPFAPYQDLSESVEEKQISLTPAEMFELSDMKLIGIKWGSGMTSSKALFKSPDQVVHVLQKHDRIGSSRGIIYQLREDEVVVLNPRIDVDKDTYEPVVITLDRWKSKTLDSNESPITSKKTGS